MTPVFINFLPSFFFLSGLENIQVEILKVLLINKDHSKVSSGTEFSSYKIFSVQLNTVLTIKSFYG